MTGGFVERREVATLAAGPVSATDGGSPEADSSCADGSRRSTKPPVLLLVKPDGHPVYRDAA